MENNKFVIKEYGRSELAVLYNPHIDAMSAWRKLKAWICNYPHLQDNLEAFGYNDSQRSFTPMQVRLIVNALGEP